MRWRITIAVRPHSTGAGHEADRKAAGTEGGNHYFYVDADDFQDAVKQARCFAEGVKSHPAVWEAPIMGVHVLNLDISKLM